MYAKNMKTIVMSVFSGCGKTYLASHQDELKFRLPYIREVKNTSFEEYGQVTFKDSDSSKWEKQDGWEKDYIDDALAYVGKVDFIFVSMRDVVLQELNRRNIPFVMVFPKTIWCQSEREKLLIKQQFFGRFRHAG